MIPKTARNELLSNSNLATPTYFFPQGTGKKQLFTGLKNSVADNSGRSIKRKPEVNALGYPYRKCRLVHYNYSPDKKWYILFYAYDIGLKKLVRKRVGKDELAQIRDIEERKMEALANMRDIDHTLSTTGYVENSKKKSKEKENIPTHDFHGYKLLNAIEFVHNYKAEIEKRSKGTLKQYRYLKTTLGDFLKSHGEEDMLLRSLKPSLVDQFTRYISVDRALENKTHNGIVTTLHSAIELLRSLDEKLFPGKNPVPTRKLPENSMTHAAYTIEQLQNLSDAIRPEDPQLLLFIYFIYFTLGRPKEIRLIKVGHIEIDLHRIKFDGDAAKTNQEKFVGISPAFEKIIRESGILSYPAEHYVFSRSGHPNIKPAGTNYFSKRLRPYIKKFKELNDRYTLYSFKHTGAIRLYLASKDIELIRKQCRHQDLSQTHTYLQQLGLFTDYQGLKDWTGF